MRWIVSRRWKAALMWPAERREISRLKQQFARSEHDECSKDALDAAREVIHHRARSKFYGYACPKKWPRIKRKRIGGRWTKWQGRCHSCGAPCRQVDIETNRHFCQDCIREITRDIVETAVKNREWFDPDCFVQHHEELNSAEARIDLLLHPLAEDFSETSTALREPAAHSADPMVDVRESDSEYVHASEFSTGYDFASRDDLMRYEGGLRDWSKAKPNSFYAYDWDDHGRVFPQPVREAFLSWEAPTEHPAQPNIYPAERYLRRVAEIEARRMQRQRRAEEFLQAWGARRRILADVT